MADEGRCDSICKLAISAAPAHAGFGHHYEGEQVQVCVGNSIYAGTVCALSQKAGNQQCKIRWQWTGFKPSWVDVSDILDLSNMGTDRRGRRTSRRDRSSTPVQAYERTVALEHIRKAERAAAAAANGVSTNASSRAAANSSRSVGSDSRDDESADHDNSKESYSDEQKSEMERRKMFAEDFDVVPRSNWLQRRQTAQHRIAGPADQASGSLTTVSAAGTKRRRQQISTSTDSSTTPSPAVLSLSRTVEPPAGSLTRWLLAVSAVTGVPSLRHKLTHKFCLDAAMKICGQSSHKQRRRGSASTPAANTSTVVSASEFAEAFRCAWAATPMPFAFRQVAFVVLTQLHCDGLLCGLAADSAQSACEGVPGSVAPVRLPALILLWNSCLLWQIISPTVWLNGWLPLMHAAVLLEWLACTSAEQQDSVAQRLVLSQALSRTAEGGQLPPHIQAHITSSMQCLQQHLLHVRATAPMQESPVELTCTPASAVWGGGLRAAPKSSTHSDSHMPSIGSGGASLAADEHSSISSAGGSTWVADIFVSSSPRRQQHTRTGHLARKLFESVSAEQLNPSEREDGLECLAQHLLLAAHAQCVCAVARISGLARAALCVQGTNCKLPSLLQSVPCDDDAYRSAFDQLMSSERTADCLILWHRCSRELIREAAAAEPLCVQVLRDSRQWASVVASAEQTLPGAPPQYHQLKSGLPDAPLQIEQPGKQWAMPQGTGVMDTVEAIVGPAQVCED